MRVSECVSVCMCAYGCAVRCRKSNYIRFDTCRLTTTKYSSNFAIEATSLIPRKLHHDTYNYSVVLAVVAVAATTAAYIIVLFIFFPCISLVASVVIAC